MLLDPKYKGRIVIENQPEEIVAYMGKASGVDDVYNMTDDQLATVKGLLEQLKPNVLKFAQQATDSVNVDDQRAKPGSSPATSATRTGSRTAADRRSRGSSPRKAPSAGWTPR